MSEKPDCVVLVAHGVGNQEPGCVLEEFQAGLLAFLNRRLRRQSRVGSEPAPVLGGLDKGFDLLLGPGPEVAAPDQARQARVRLREFHWADLDGDLAPGPANFLSMLGWLLSTLTRIKPSRLLPPGVGLVKGLGLCLRAAGLFVSLLLATLLGLALSGVNALFRGRYGSLAEVAGMAMEYLGDIRQMDDRLLRQSVNQRLHRTVNEVMALDQPRFLVLVSHSLGNVFVCDQLTRQLKRAPLPMGWISLGSPLWVLPMLEDRYSLPHDLNLNLDLGWYNLYDPMDPLAGPVRNPSLANPDDQWYRQHWTPLAAHASYFQDGGHLERLWEAICLGLEKTPAARLPIEVRAPLNRRPLALGPFPRHGAPDELAVWTRFWQPGLHRARLFKDGREVDSLEHMVSPDDQLTHLWRFTGLKPATAYRLELHWRDEEHDQWWRLAQINRPHETLAQAATDWELTTPRPREEGPWRFLFASCHHPRHVHWDGLDGNWFIAQLLKRQAADPASRPDALFLVGDQIYADDWWEDHLLLPWAERELRLKARLATYSDCYGNFWRHQPWGDLLRQAPSYMMWDDHDLRDGWGSNVHDFAGDDFSPPAKEKFTAASRAFQLYQAQGNPPAASGDDFQFTLDWGPISFFIFDPRTHRRFRDPVDYHPFGPEQMARYRQWLQDAGQRAQVLVVVTSSPTAFIRRWRLDLVANRMDGIMRWGEKFLHAEAFDDDLRDQLPCGLNVRARDAIVGGLAGVLMSHAPGTKRALLMAGDVHVGAHSRVKLDAGRAIDLWTASPSSNIPNWKLRWLAALALPGRPAGELNGHPLRATGQWTKSARNAVSLCVEPHPVPGQAPLVRGELIYESGFGTKSIKRTLG